MGRSSEFELFSIHFQYILQWVIEGIFEKFAWLQFLDFLCVWYLMLYQPLIKCIIFTQFGIITNDLFEIIVMHPPHYLCNLCMFMDFTQIYLLLFRMLLVFLMIFIVVLVVVEYSVTIFHFYLTYACLQRDIFSGTPFKVLYCIENCTVMHF